MQLSFRNALLIAAAGYAVYFPLALNFKWSYAPPPKLACDDQRTWLTGPFVSLGGAAYVAYLPKQEGQADSADEPERSTVTLYEDDKQIGPPHTQHGDIIEHGAGRYSHWKGQGLIFSSSDNSDPNHNWKRYWIRANPAAP